MTQSPKGSRWAMLLVTTVLLAACGGAPAAEPTAAPAAEPTQAPTAVSVIDQPTAVPEPTAVPSGAGVELPNGKVLPDDAAPLDQQVIYTYHDSTTTCCKQHGSDE